jgi:hypothetical protein
MRLVRWFCLPLAMALVLGCDSRASRGQQAVPAQAPVGSVPELASGAQAPSRVVYPADPAVYGKGVAITPDIPYSTGGLITSYRVNPPLPAGLSLNPATGVLSGTPTAVAASATYQVTASNGVGSTSVNLTLTVNDQAPMVKPVVTLAPFVTESSTGLAASIQDQGPDQAYAWTLSGGSITSGQGTPSITYTAGGPGGLTASVTVSNTGGSVSGSAEATVVRAPDGTMTFPVAIQTLDGSKRASVQAQPGMTYEWTVLPGTSSASIASGQGSNSVGLLAGRNPGSFQLQVKVQNQAGQYRTAVATIQVQTGYP